jgi:hypothetical protein
MWSLNHLFSFLESSGTKCFLILRAAAPPWILLHILVDQSCMTKKMLQLCQVCFYNFKLKSCCLYLRGLDPSATAAPCVQHFVFFYSIDKFLFSLPIKFTNKRHYWQEADNVLHTCSRELRQYHTDIEHQSKPEQQYLRNLDGKKSWF